MTQEVFAKRLAVSRQAVSKWENGQSYPDIAMLPKIAALFGISIDELLNFKGSKILTGAHEVLRLMPPTRKVNVLEIGCGEGQAAIFFARNGYLIDAFDIAEAGLAKGRAAAQSIGVPVNFFCANLLTYQPERKYDVIYSSGVLQYIPPSGRERVMRTIQNATKIGGLNILDTFVEKSFIRTAPDWEHGKEFFWKSAELFSYYAADWKYELIKENYFDCDSGGVHHRHCTNAIIARKIV